MRSEKKDRKYSTKAEVFDQLLYCEEQCLKYEATLLAVEWQKYLCLGGVDRKQMHGLAV